MSLKVNAIDVAYGSAQVLYQLSFTARPGEVTCLLGRNGAGKSTTLKAIIGLLPLGAGSVFLHDTDIGSTPASATASQGIALVPQGRGLFGGLSVSENLQIGLMARPNRSKADSRLAREKVLALFPRLRERLSQRSSTLSGGEQQMLATARALCNDPAVLLLDEPTEGLQPSIAHLLRDVTRQLAEEGVAIVLVEQHIDTVLDLADHAVLIENGRLTGQLTRSEITAQALTRHLGV
jgi:branched-chain amino acid transport system ATP-binding protein